MAIRPIGIKLRTAFLEKHVLDLKGDVTNLTLVSLSTDVERDAYGLLPERQ